METIKTFNESAADLQGAVTTTTNWKDFTASFGHFDTSGGPLFPTRSYTFVPTAYWWWDAPASQSRVERAYLVLRALMKAKVVKITTLGKFFEAMDAVVAAL
jgi:hypothetical protein